jgi:hypothetical protein
MYTHSLKITNPLVCDVLLLPPPPFLCFLNFYELSHLTYSRTQLPSKSINTLDTLQSHKLKHGKMQTYIYVASGEIRTRNRIFQEV